MDLNKDKSFTDIQADALSAALKDENERAARLKKNAGGCVVSLSGALGHLWNGWMLMFLVALLGFPTGYWTCVLAAYVVSCLIGSGTWTLGVNLAKIQKGLEK